MPVIKNPNPSLFAEYLMFDLARRGGGDSTAIFKWGVRYAKRQPSPDMATMCDDLGIEPRVQARERRIIIDSFSVVSK
jgi:hypothetical protein